MAVFSNGRDTRLPYASVDGRLAPQAVRDDSPLLGWRTSSEETRQEPSSGSVPGGYPFKHADDEEEEYSGRHSTDSDLYNFYSADDHHSHGFGHAHHPSNSSNVADMPALSALSNILLSASQPAGPQSRSVEPYDNPELAGNQLHPNAAQLDQDDLDHDSSSDDKDAIDLDPTMRYSFIPSVSPQSHSPTRPGPNQNMMPDASSAPSAPAPTSFNQDTVGRAPSQAGKFVADDGRSIPGRVHGHSPVDYTDPTAPSGPNTIPLSRTNSTSPSYSGNPQSRFRSTPPSRSNSIAKSHSPYPPHMSQTSQSVSSTPRQSTAGQNSSPTSSSSHAFPSASPPYPSPNTQSYSQPIPRPQRTRNDAVSQLHRGSSISGGSRSSGSPPVSAAQSRTQSARRQSGLRSSIVSADLEWEKGNEGGGALGGPDGDNYYESGTGFELAPSDPTQGRSSFLDHRSTKSGDSDLGHGGEVPGLPQGAGMSNSTRAASPGPSSSSYYSSIRPGSSFQASRPPSSYQDSGRGSAYGSHGDSSFQSPMTADTSVTHSVASSPEVGKRAPSLHSRPSRTNLQQNFGGAVNGMSVARTPSNGQSHGLGLARSPSSGSLMTGGRSVSGNARPSPAKGLSRTTSAQALNAGSRSASGSNLAALGRSGPSPALSRSNSYSNKSNHFAPDSPEPPVPPLPSTIRPVDEGSGSAVGMATTADEPVHLSSQVNRSRASSVTQHPHPDLLALASAVESPPIMNSRTSWGGHPPPPLASQRSSEWATVQEDDGEMSMDGTGTDLEDADGDVEDDDGDHTYNSTQSRPGQGQNLTNRPSMVDSSTNILPSTRYSIGSSVADEWEADSGGMKQRRTKPRRTGGAEETDVDVSEISESEFEEMPSSSKKARHIAEEERTAAIVVAEEGGGMIVHLSGSSLVGMDLTPGTTHVVMSMTTTPDLAPSFLNGLSLVADTLLALDISSNYLMALPPALGTCSVLEELNVGGNPLGSLPPWLANLGNLQVLIADSTGVTTLPADMAALTGLRTLSLRRNRILSLPSWLCLLTNMEWLLVDENPFSDPWRGLIDPLLNPVPQTPAYTPNTPFSAVSMDSGITGDSASPPVSAGPRGMYGHHEESSLGHGDQTITIPSFPFPGSGATPVSSASAMPTYHVYTPSINGFAHAGPNSSSVTLASPPPTGGSAAEYDSSPYFPATSGRPNTVTGSTSRFRRMQDGEEAESLRVPPIPQSVTPGQGSAFNGALKTRDGAASETETKSIKRMKSADDVRKRNRAGSVSAAMAAAANAVSNSSGMFKSNTHPVPPMPSPMPSPLPSPSPANQALYGANEVSPDRGQPPKFMSLGMRGASQGYPAPNRPALTNSLWESPSNGTNGGSPHTSELGVFSESPVDVGDPAYVNNDGRQYSPTGPPASKSSQFVAHDDGTGTREKVKKWGFLKKMSMSKMRGGVPSVPQETVRAPKTVKSKRPVTPQTGQANEFTVRTPGRSPNLAPTIGVTPAASPSFGGVSLTPPNMQRAHSTVDLGSPTLLPPTTSRPGRRRSFLPLDTPPILNIPIDKSPLISSIAISGFGAPPDTPDTNGSLSATSSTLSPNSALLSPQYQDITIHVQSEHPAAVMSAATNEQYAVALRSVMAYLRDMLDLGGGMMSPPSSVYGATSPSGPTSSNSSPMPDRSRRPTLVGGENPTDSVFGNSFAAPSRPLRSMASTTSLRGGQAMSMITTDSGGSGSGGGATEERKWKDDKGKRVHLVKEIVETERTYVKQMQELIDIYIQPASQLVNSITAKTESIVPLAERRIVFNGLEALYSFHTKNFLPVLEKEAAPIMAKKNASEGDGETSARVARDVAGVFVSHAAFMRMYSTYINNFDNCLQRLKQWTEPPLPQAPPAPSSAALSTGHVVGLGLTMSAMGAIMPPESPSNVAALTNSQRRRIKAFLKRCRHNPRHSQLNLEGYLLLPVQRIPRYKLLLEQLVTCTPPRPDSYDDMIEKALEEISSLATNMNEGKRESESRRKLVQWQTRIKGRFPSPLVQPHRRLIMDGYLKLSKVVRKDAQFVQSSDIDGNTIVIQVECLTAESNARQLVAILCNDLLVLCKDQSRGRDKTGPVDLWAVLRMQTLPQPASIVSGHTLRLVDHKAIMYFEMGSTSEALTWSRAINMHIPANRP